LKVRLTSFAPEYKTLDLHLTADPDQIGLQLNDGEIKKYNKQDVGFLGIGLVNTFANAEGFAEPDLALRISEQTGRVLDVLADLGIENLFLIKYSNLPEGTDLLEEIAEFEPDPSEPEEGTKIYESACRNPTIDTDILRDISELKVLLVEGLQAHTNVLTCIETLLDKHPTNPIALENLYVIDSCTKTTSAVKHANEKDYWAKQAMEEAGAKIVEVYAGDTKIA